MNEIENYSTRYDRFLEEWNNGMSVERMEEWLKAAYDMGLKHKCAIMWGIVGASEWVGTYRNHAVCQVK